MVKKPNKKLSTTLHKRTRLNPEQLKRLEQQSGKGLSTKYEGGKVSLELVKRLVKAKKKSEKFALFTDQLGRRMYIADRELVGLERGCTPITFNLKEALLFYEGFDEPEIKIKYYNELTKLNFQTIRNNERNTMRP